MRSIGSVLDEAKGLGPGFDFLRVFLAFGVIFTHSLGIVGARSVDETPVLWFNNYWILAMFFGLSGFLITGSALRLSLRDFLINRGLRIVPALGVEIVFAAFLMGPLVTTLTLQAYFSDPQTYHYLTNIVGWINYLLPGVFKDHPAPQVNLSLWTVPHELGCYAIMSALIAFGLLKRPALVVVAAAVIMLGGIGLVAAGYAGEHHRFLQEFEYILFYGPSTRLYYSFLLGIAAYLYRHRLPYSWPLFGAMMVLSIGIALIPPGPWASYPVLNAVDGAPMAYIMAFLGATKLPRLPFFHTGDYSYGIYLYGFPVQQLAFSLIPASKSTVLNFVISAVLVTVFAAFSWHCIEKQIMKLRKRFSFVARQRLTPEHPKEVAAGSSLSPGVVKPGS
jgi:peptidoglycan/LPS O-acetylase OafA/YrhL